MTDTPVNGSTTETQYYGTNPHGDVETLSKADGTTASTYRYTAYGAPDKKGTTGQDAYSTAASETDKMAADLAAWGVPLSNGIASPGKRKIAERGSVQLPLWEDGDL